MLAFVEAVADAITRDVLQSVQRTFITPFDRGDIKDLISAMDDAIGNFWGCVAGPGNAGCDTVIGPASIIPVQPRCGS